LERMLPYFTARLPKWNARARMVARAPRRSSGGGRKRGSAVFAPLENLGLVVVDEEQGSELQAGKKPHVITAGDVAIVRAKLEGGRGAAGFRQRPSLESFLQTHASGKISPPPARIARRESASCAGGNCGTCAKISGPRTEPGPSPRSSVKPSRRVSVRARSP